MSSDDDFIPGVPTTPATTFADEVATLKPFLVAEDPHNFRRVRITAEARCVCNPFGALHAMADCGRCGGVGWIAQTYEPEVTQARSADGGCALCETPEPPEDWTATVYGARKYREFTTAMNYALGV